MESGKVSRNYPQEVEYVLNAQDPAAYLKLALTINAHPNIAMVVVQHEFGFFQDTEEPLFLSFLELLASPVITVFHTVLPHPEESLQAQVRDIAKTCSSVVVMTKHSAQVLQKDYDVPAPKIAIIAHGTHLVSHLDKALLKDKYKLSRHKVLSTFGLLSSGKGIQTTLNALPAIIKINPNVIFLVIGKTHPGVILAEGEKYRRNLEAKVAALQLQNHVRFINRYLPLQDLLEYLQLTDFYLFTSKDPNQAVSGTFSYALSCACPIISTPIPHSREVLSEDTGIIIDFQNSQQLTDGVNLLLSDEALRSDFSSSTLQRIVPSAWENSAIAHALLFQQVAEATNSLNPIAKNFSLQYRMPPLKLDHLKKMTTDFGIIQFSKINQPDIESGYTLDDNARALIAVCMHYEATADPADLDVVATYLYFIQFCQFDKGDFLNYVNQETEFTEQNKMTNLEDANGRAIGDLGYFTSRNALFPAALASIAEGLLRQAKYSIEKMHSPRAMAFALKGLYYSNQQRPTFENSRLIKILANRLVQLYDHESEKDWIYYHRQCCEKLYDSNQFDI